MSARWYKQNLYCLLLATVALLFVNGCGTSSGSAGVGWGGSSNPQPVEIKKNGPPAHAPAHGRRAKHGYRYYTDSSVYYDTGRHLYFYLNNGNWQVSVSLPSHISLGPEYVNLELDTEKPYLDNADHRTKYPPGKAKGKKEKKNKH